MISNWIKAITVIAMTTCSATGFASGCTSSSPEVKSISAPTFDREMSDKDVEIVDVRTPAEYAEGHIAGAINIDIQSADFAQTASKTLDKEKTIYVYCRSGKRSLRAADELLKLGYKVVNLKGGIMEWTEAGLPVVVVDDLPDKKIEEK